jgi:TolB-like protein
MDGLLEAVAHMLSKFRDIRVAGFSKAMQFKGALKDPAAMGAALGVSHLAGGSVMARNGALKIRYRLVAAADGALIASGDVDHDSADAFALLEDAPARLVVFLAHHLANSARDAAIATPQNHRSAFQHLLVGIHFGFFVTPTDYSAALAAFESGLALTPEEPNLDAYAVWAKAGLGHALREPERTHALAQAHRAVARADSATT